MNVFYAMIPILAMLVVNMSFYFRDILDFFQGKRKDKIKIKELELEIINSKSNKKGDNSCNHVSPQKKSKTSAHQWFQTIIAAFAVLASIIVPLLMHFL